jgi:hypothetical protein
LQILPGVGGLLSADLGLGGRDRILFQVVGGNGISRFITALGGQGLDVIFDPNTGKFETVASIGGFVSLEHDWRPNLFMFVTVGLIEVENKEFEPDDAFSNSGYASANLFWNATAGSRLGVEFSLGRRENKDGQDGLASRLAFIMYFDF